MRILYARLVRQRFTYLVFLLFYHLIHCFVGRFRHCSHLTYVFQLSFVLNTVILGINDVRSVGFF